MKMRWSSAHSRSQSFDPFGHRRGSITWIESSGSSSGWFQLKGLFWLALKHKGNKPKVKGEVNKADDRGIRIGQHFSILAWRIQFVERLTEISFPTNTRCFLLNKKAEGVYGECVGVRKNYRYFEWEWKVE